MFNKAWRDEKRMINRQIGKIIDGFHQKEGFRLVIGQIDFVWRSERFGTFVFNWLSGQTIGDECFSFYPKKEFLPLEEKYGSKCPKFLRLRTRIQIFRTIVRIYMKMLVCRSEILTSVDQIMFKLKLCQQNLMFLVDSREIQWKM